MGDVVSLDQARDARRRRWRAQAAQAVMHPALRWQVDGGVFGHRRSPGGGTACGLTGDLTMADAGVGRCPVCYPAVAAELLESR
ncbi:hypothetical protein ACFY05_32310 [Microtetraspora fusca]|uniref:Uncharacterized protein n=1 Tax=Microtetraspora fusca TaxID=1997 RepID=A0ABW6VE16_MICFU